MNYSREAIRLSIDRLKNCIHVKSEHDQYSWARCFATAVAWMVVALGLRLAFAPVDAGLPYVTFYPAVTLAAILGGYRAGIMATLVGLIFASFIFTAPYYTVSTDVLGRSLWSNLVFLTGGVIVSFAVAMMHGYRHHYWAALKLSENERDELAQSAKHLRRIIDNLY